ncbi:hypothetical protein C2S52_017361 [Perilla frutescens var. hirtella]|nr:hypothetical protein C2S52_017361 [Perilla frutescens var. hirtella]
MWRRSAAGFGDDARGNENSDLSISEEEEVLDEEWTRNTVSLGGGESDKGKLCVLAQLEIFEESCELHSTEESISSHGKKGGYHIKDEVETPIFNDVNSTSQYHRIASATLAPSNEGLIYLPHVGSVSYADEEIISDDEIEKINPHTFRSARENLAITWSEANREVEALVRSNENPCCSSDHQDAFLKEKKSTRGGGGRRKAKAKFSFPCHSDKKELSLVVSDGNIGTSFANIPAADEVGAVSDDEMDNYMADSELNVHDKHIPPFEMAHKHDTREHSMAEILSSFLEMSDMQEGSSKLEIQKRRREQTVLESDVSPLGESTQEEDDLPGALDTDTSFESEDEENAQSVKSIISRTMADQFHEAFRTISAIDDGSSHDSFPRPLCGGIYRRLQQVNQIEKERDIDSLKNASAETGFKDEEMSILVRISSRSLEAKLIVCSCICVGDGKNSSRENLEMELRSITRTMTIIFNPRMSSDVDLEVGNLICIHPPWKEVQVKDEVIFLCSYFYQVQRAL